MDCICATLHLWLTVIGRSLSSMAMHFFWLQEEPGFTLTWAVWIVFCVLTNFSVEAGQLTTKFKERLDLAPKFCPKKDQMVQNINMAANEELSAYSCTYEERNPNIGLIKQCSVTECEAWRNCGYG